MPCCKHWVRGAPWCSAWLRNSACCADALALCRRGFKVDVVADAIKPITEEGGRKALEEMAAAGVRMVTTAEVCNPVAPPTTLRSAA